MAGGVRACGGQRSKTAVVRAGTVTASAATVLPLTTGTGAGWTLHDVQASGTDPVVRGSTVAADAVTVPARTTAVFER